MPANASHVNAPGHLTGLLAQPGTPVAGCVLQEWSGRMCLGTATRR